MKHTVLNNEYSSRVLSYLEMHSELDRKVQDVGITLKNIQMIETFGQIALEHNFSAPVVATMRAVPGFIEAVKEFPESDNFSVVPEHKTSTQQGLGLESLARAQSENVSSVCERAKMVASSVESLLGSLGEVAELCQTKLSSMKVKLDCVEVPDDVLHGISVYTMSQEGFEKLFGMLEHYLKEIEIFDTEKLRANPDTIRKEIDALCDIVGDLGDALGLSINEYGIHESDKSEEYVSKASTFGERGLTKITLLSYLGRAYDLCDILKGIDAKKEEIVSSLYKACDDIPDTLNSNDVDYGANEHFTLFSCYVSLTTKLVREALVMVSRLITTAESAVELDEEINSPSSDAPAVSSS